MTNKEKYQDKIVEIALGHDSIAVNKKGEPVSCRGFACENCLCNSYTRINDSCVNGLKKWANEEYRDSTIVPDDTPVDTKVLVSDDMEHWVHRYFSHNANGLTYVFTNGKTSFTSNPMDTLDYKYSKLYEEDKENNTFNDAIDQCICTIDNCTTGCLKDELNALKK